MMSSEYSEVDRPASQLIECVERALSRYGGTTVQVVFWNFEKKFNVQKEDLTKHPEKFMESIEDMFGAGARTVEKTIIQEIRSSLPLGSFDDSNLLTTLKQARAFFQRNGEE
jgi:hypothetical protein